MAAPKPDSFPQKELPGYKRIQFLQSGNYGAAWLEQDLATKENVAVKYISRARGASHNFLFTLPKRPTDVQSSLNYLARELVIHRRIQHPHVIAFRKALLTDTHIAIVLEFAAGGELFGELSHGRLEEETSRNVFQQVVSAVSYIHTLGIAHRDLKLENVLLMSPDRPGPGKRMVVKLCDFGFSRLSALGEGDHSGNERLEMNTVLGSPPYMAPELLTLRKGETYDGRKVDVWAVGVLLYTMLMSEYPFGNAEVDRVGMMRNIQQVRYRKPTHVSPECLNLFDRIFVADPEQRISMDGIMHHPWFLTNCPADLQAGASGRQPEPPGLQTEAELEELARIVLGGRGGQPATSQQPQQTAAQAAAAAQQQAAIAQQQAAAAMAAAAAAQHPHQTPPIGSARLMSGGIYDGDEMMGEAPDDLYA